MITAYHGTGSSPSQIKKYGLKPLDFRKVADDILEKYKHRKIPKWVNRAIDREIKYREGQQNSVHLTLSKEQAVGYSGSSGGEFARAVEQYVRNGLHLKKKDWFDTTGYVVAVKIPKSKNPSYYSKEPLQAIIDRFEEHNVPREEWGIEVTRPYISPSQIISVEKAKEPKVKAKKFEVLRLDYTPTGMVVRKRKKDGTWAVVTTEKGKPMKMYHGTRAGEIKEFKAKHNKNQQLGFGIHFTPDKEFAEMYAFDKYTAKRGKSPFVNEAHIDVNRLLNANQIVREGTPEFELAMKLAKGSRKYQLPVDKDENGVRATYLQRAIDYSSPERAEKLIKEAGYDGILYNAILENMSPVRHTVAEAPTYVVLNPQSVIHKGGYSAPKTKKMKATVRAGRVR